MIYAQLMGGLGNQIFIYSFCRKLIDETGQNAILYFDSEDARSLEISHFQLNDRVKIIEAAFPPQNVNNLNSYLFWRKVIEHLPTCRLRDFIIKIAFCFGVVFIPEGYVKVNYDILAKKKNIIVNGFFQADRYTDTVKALIKDEMTIKNEYGKKLEIKNKKLMSEIKSRESVCLHIRRGDYITPKYRKNFLVCTDQYYRDAISYMTTAVKDPIFYVFSDSIELVKREMSFLEAWEPVYIDSGGDTAVIGDFLMMKQCRHFIMSNSTLSWWAQYLSENEEKIVIAPSRWLNKKKYHCELYQKNWHLINV